MTSDPGSQCHKRSFVKFISKEVKDDYILAAGKR